MPKAPPRFVQNLAAWEYTLAKLASKDKLTADGDPENYAAAAAIYKAVVKKYGDALSLDRLSYSEAAMPSVTRAEAIAFKAAAWRVAHDSAWAIAHDGAYQRLYFDFASRIVRTDDGHDVLEPRPYFRIERHLDDGSTHTKVIDHGTAAWITSESPAAHEFVLGKITDALTRLGDLYGEIENSREYTAAVFQIDGHDVASAAWDADISAGLNTGAERALLDAIAGVQS